MGDTDLKPARRAAFGPADRLCWPRTPASVPPDPARSRGCTQASPTLDPGARRRHSCQIRRENTAVRPQLAFFIATESQ